MNDWDWTYFLLGLVAWQVLKMLAVSINNAVIERREKRFLKMVSVKFPDHTKIAYIAMDTSDKRAMDRLERQIREEYDIVEKTS